MSTHGGGLAIIIQRSQRGNHGAAGKRMNPLSDTSFCCNTVMVCAIRNCLPPIGPDHVLHR